MIDLIFLGGVASSSVLNKALLSGLAPSTAEEFVHSALTDSGPSIALFKVAWPKGGVCSTTSSSLPDSLVAALRPPPCCWKEGWIMLWLKFLFEWLDSLRCELMLLALCLLEATLLPAILSTVPATMIMCSRTSTSGYIISHRYWYNFVKDSQLLWSSSNLFFFW